MQGKVGQAMEMYIVLYKRGRRLKKDIHLYDANCYLIS